MIVQTALSGQEGHVPSSLSILDVVWSIYNGGFVERGGDSSFVLSKGHGSLALYVVLAHRGWFPREWLANFASFDSNLGGHPDRSLIPGVEASTGSLGHGFPFSAGLAYSKRLSGSPGRVFTLVGDGELNEGSMWETAMVASHHRLANLVCIVDDNGTSHRAINMGSISDKFSAFGWAVSEIDGHDLQQIHEALTRIPKSPHAIIAKTVKGKGFAEMEGNPAWHHAKIHDEDIRRWNEQAKS